MGWLVLLTSACRSRRVPVMASGLYHPLVLLDVYRDVNDELHRELCWIKGEQVAMDHQADVLHRREQVGPFLRAGAARVQARRIALCTGRKRRGSSEGLRRRLHADHATRNTQRTTVTM